VSRIVHDGLLSVGRSQLCSQGLALKKEYKTLHAIAQVAHLNILSFSTKLFTPFHAIALRKMAVASQAGGALYTMGTFYIPDHYCPVIN